VRPNPAGYPQTFVSSSSSADRRVALPEGTLPVGVALLVAGIATYAFFRIGEWALGGPEEFEPIVSMWFATFAIAPGLYLPLEQELGRALSHRRARDEGGRPVVRKVVSTGLVIAAIVLIVVVMASPLITSDYFDGDWWMLAALATSFVAYAPSHIARGVCAGMGRFRAYAFVIGSDGIIRIVICVAMALVGIKAAGAYGFAVALAPLLPVGIAWMRGSLRTEPGPEATWQETSQNLGWLLVGTVCAGALLNAGPVTANLLQHGEGDDLVTQFGYGVLLARIPLFLFQAVQAALLPRLSRLAARGEFDEFRSGLKKLLQIIVVIGVVGTLGAYVLGPWVIELVYNAEDIGGRTLAMLALSSAIYMACLATGQAVIALHGHAQVAIGWAVGVGAFALGTWLSSDQLFRRIEIGLVISSSLSLATFALALRQKLRAGAQPTTDSVLEAITELPLDT
jgi:O-antigen/teichoic acid export membrane protein